MVTPNTDEFARVVFFLGQFPGLRPYVRSTLVSSLPLWFVNGRQCLARLAGEYQIRSGWSTDHTHLPRAVRDAVKHKILTEWGPRVYEFRDPMRWAWPPGARDRANVLWRQSFVAAGWELQTEMELLEQVVAQLPPTAWAGQRLQRPTGHPDDRESIAWHEALRELRDRLGADALRGALEELARTPALPVWTPRVLGEQAWAWAVRARVRAGLEGNRAG